MTTLTIDEIKAQYPDQWVLVGNPVMDSSNNHGTVVERILRGYVLSANVDKRKLAEHAKSLRVGYYNLACIYTGTFPTNRRWLL